MQTIQVCAAPLGRVFEPFWSENGYRLCPFGLESGMVFEGTTGAYEGIYRFNSKLIRKKERKICEVEMDLKFFCLLLI